jgi:hypothetical protein
MSLYSLASLNTMLTLSTSITAATIKHLRAPSTETMQLNYTTNIPAEMCKTLYRINECAAR